MSGERTARVGEFERAFTAALLAGDQIAAETTIREAMDARLSSAQIDDGIIAPPSGRSASYGSASPGPGGSAG